MFQVIILFILGFIYGTFTIIVAHEIYSHITFSFIYIVNAILDKNISNKLTQTSNVTQLYLLTYGLLMIVRSIIMLYIYRRNTNMKRIVEKYLSDIFSIKINTEYNSRTEYIISNSICFIIHITAYNMSTYNCNPCLYLSYIHILWLYIYILSEYNDRLKHLLSSVTKQDHLLHHKHITYKSSHCFTCYYGALIYYKFLDSINNFCYTNSYVGHIHKYFGTEIILLSRGFYNTDKTIMTFPTHFDSPLDNIIFPLQLKSIIFGNRFNKPINKISTLYNLESITIGRYFKQTFDDVMHLSKLRTIHYKYNTICETRYVAGMCRIFCSGSQIFDTNFKIIKFPKSVRHIIFDGSLHASIDNLPNHIEELSFQHIRNNISNLPASITRINMLNKDTESNKITKVPYGCVFYDYLGEQISTKN
ncbi:MAG: hypothetical protein Gaeavirus3_5 [Gaeavirus sp.]|uniref:Uncharacterized protein n=1 Tax=Gaeavirus sp. TaxID=2487767 RepID=A0A3G5A188_9VIRU|nr:MAG: hypothetical protein Gaeavirus3_5 [Gaeavirus sp.]